MDDLNIEGLQQLWQFQDGLENHSKTMLMRGMELGCLAFSIELMKEFAVRGDKPADEETLLVIQDRAMKLGIAEIEKRFGRARGPETKL